MISDLQVLVEGREMWAFGGVVEYGLWKIRAGIEGMANTS